MKELSERYMEEHCLVHNKASSARRNKYILKCHIVPKLGRLKVTEVNRPEIAEMISGMRKTPVAANHTLATLRKMFNLAEIWGWRPDGTNPCRHIRKFSGGKRTPHHRRGNGPALRLPRSLRRRGAWLVIDPATVRTSYVSWTGGRRIIRSLYPPIDLFEDIADPEDWPLVIAAEQKTNPRLMETLGALDLMPPDRRVAGPGATYLMAPFTHVSPDRSSRFTRGEFGVLYVAERFETALLSRPGC